MIKPLRYADIARRSFEENDCRAALCLAQLKTIATTEATYEHHKHANGLWVQWMDKCYKSSNR